MVRVSDGSSRAPSLFLSRRQPPRARPPAPFDHERRHPPAFSKFRIPRFAYQPFRLVIKLTFFFSFFNPLLRPSSQMSFLKKFTRSRSNSNSFVDDYDEHDTQQPDGPYDPNRPPSSWKFDGPQSPPASATFDSRGGDKMFQNGGSQQLPYQNSQRSSGISNQNGGVMTGRSSRDGFVDVQPVNQPMNQSLGQPLSPNGASPQQPSKMEHHGPAPDALARAFHESVRPYTDKIEALEQQIGDLQAFVDQLEQDRLEMYGWIDKRGLRSGMSTRLWSFEYILTFLDVPPSIAKQMDSTPGAAEALNTQLDRKITIVNFDLHRLQDDLNDSISSAHFAASMIKFIPDIQRLSNIPTGPRYAYDLIIKLVGNLNSHGGVEANREMANDAEIAEDSRARQDFYERMDHELIEVVHKRAQEGENWDVQKEIRRFERNAAFLKNLGIDTYFPHALDTMKQEASGGYSAGGAAQSGQTSSPRYLPK